jgi:hypothetical protein
MPRSVQSKISRKLALIREIRGTGCVTRLDAVPLRTSLKQGKRQKPVPHHRPALTGRKSSMGVLPRKSGTPLKIARVLELSRLDLDFPENRTHKAD